MVFLKIVSDLFIIKETEKRQGMFDLGRRFVRKRSRELANK